MRWRSFAELGRSGGRISGGTEGSDPELRAWVESAVTTSSAHCLHSVSVRIQLWITESKITVAYIRQKFTSLS